MSFELELRERIRQAALGSAEKNVLRVVLGECQLMAKGNSITEEMGIQVVKKMLKSNRENQGYVKNNASRLKEFEDESQVLESLLPEYWTEDEVLSALASVDLRSQATDNQAVGAAMQHLRKLNAVVDGSDVRKIVLDLRKTN